MRNYKTLGSCPGGLCRHPIAISVLEALNWAVLSTGQGGGGGTVRQLQLCLVTVDRAVGKVTEGFQGLQQFFSTWAVHQAMGKGSQPQLCGESW